MNDDFFPARTTLHRRRDHLSFQRAIEHAIEGFFRTTHDGRYLAANRALARMYGYANPEALIGEITSISSQVYVDPKRREELLREIAERGAVSGAESQVRCRDGRVIWIRESMRPVFGRDGALRYYEGMAEDITERRRVEQQERLLLDVAAATTTLLATATDSSDIGKALTTLGGAVQVDRVYIFENHDDAATGEPVTSQRFEWARATVSVQIDNPDLQGFPYAMIPRWHQELSAGRPIAGLVRSFPESERAILEPQEIISILVVPIVVQGMFWGFIGFDDCRSERAWSEGERAILQAAGASFGAALSRMRAEATLRQREEQYRLVVDSVQEVIFRTNAAGRLTFLNPAWTAFTGYLPEEALGRAFLDFLHPADRETVDLALRAAMAEQRGSIRHQFRYLSRAGETRWAEAHAQLSYDDQGRAIGFAGTLSDVTQRKQYEAQIERLAYFDSLTGLANRRLLQLRAAEQIDAAAAAGGELALLYLDLNRFKLVNDTLGHDAGDDLLVEVTERLRECIGEGDVAARLGGDEFALLLARSGPRRALATAQHVRRLTDQPFVLRGKTLHLGASIGIACFPRDGRTLDELMRHADTAMYRAKTSGRGCELYAASLDPNTPERLVLSIELRRALAEDQLTLHYQPIHSLTTNRAVAFEALIRWQHPDHGMLTPDVILPLAEQTDLTIALDRWAMRAGLHQASRWGSAEHRWRIALNLSARTVRDDTFVDYAGECFAASGVHPGRVIVEVDEGVALRDVDQARPTLEGLRRLGVAIAVDNFGHTGTSLTALRRIPAQHLKIDRAVVRGVGQDDRESRVAQALVTLGHSMGMVVTVTGVERDDQLRWVRESGCDLAQGYRLGAPVPADAISHH